MSPCERSTTCSCSRSRATCHREQPDHARTETSADCLSRHWLVAPGKCFGRTGRSGQPHPYRQCARPPPASHRRSEACSLQPAGSSSPGLSDAGTNISVSSSGISRGVFEADEPRQPRTHEKVLLKSCGRTGVGCSAAKLSMIHDRGDQAPAAPGPDSSFSVMGWTSLPEQGVCK
jgi:hypothetical protein